MNAQFKFPVRFSRWMIVAAIILAGVIVAGISSGRFQTVAWAGRRTLEVKVRVVDAIAGRPISDAKVLLFRGPFAPLNGPLPDASSWTPDAKRRATRTATTNGDGLASLDYEFFAAGMEGPFRHSGYIRTNDCWIQVSTEGYSQVTLPLDRQSLKPREVDDEAPIFVTLLLSKQ